MRVPDFVIAGCPKCGSSTLQQYLLAHPGLYMGDIKEPSLYLDHWDDFGTATEAFYQQAPADALLGDATVGYVKNTAVARRIGETHHDTKIIFLFRDPIQRALSHYHHWLRHGKDVRSLPEVVRQSAIDDYFLLFSRYGSHLERFRAELPDANFFILFFEDLVADPRAALLPLWRFLGVEPLTALPDSVWENSGHSVKNRQLSATLKQAKESSTLRRIPGWLRKPAGAMVRALERWNKSNRRAQLSPRDEQALRNLFHREVKVVGEFLQLKEPQRRLPAWMYEY